MNIKRRFIYKAEFLSFTICMGLTLFGSHAIADEAEKVNQITTLAVIYAETGPNTKEEGTPRGRYKALFKQVDGLDKQRKANKYKNKKADKFIIKHGFGQLPYPMLSAILEKLKAFHVQAEALMYSNLRSKENLEKVRGQLTEKYPKLAEKGEFVISLLPYQALFKGSNEVEVWIGATIYDTKRKKNKVLDFITVSFGKKGNSFTQEDGDKLADILIKDLIERGYLSEGMKDNH